METFCALLALCEGNSPVPGEFPSQWSVPRKFEVFFDLPLNKRLGKQSWGWWFETLSCPLWRHCNESRKILDCEAGGTPLARTAGSRRPGCACQRCPTETWWRHQMETFCALLALCEGNSPVTGEFPSQWPVPRNFDDCFDLRLNKRLS